MPYTIHHRHAQALLFHSDTASTIADALAEAVKARSNLAGAYLAGKEYAKTRTMALDTVLMLLDAQNEATA